MTVKSKSLFFRKIYLPDGSSEFIPDNIDLKFPKNSSLPKKKQHFLAYIPWDKKYLKYVHEKYRDFFQIVLPFLNVRTTNVHVAICMPFIEELVKKIGKPVDEKIIYLGFILHDCGWSQMNEAEIASSLGIKGLTLTGDSINPKQKHAFLGKERAKNILSNSVFSNILSENQKEIIYNAVLLHDSPEKINSAGEIPLEIKIICDADHLWSFTHENFWQDIIRKGVHPKKYLENLNNDLESYLITKEAKEKAKFLLEDRAKEVRAWKLYIEKL